MIERLWGITGGRVVVISMGFKKEEEESRFRTVHHCDPLLENPPNLDIEGPG